MAQSDTAPRSRRPFVHAPRELAEGVEGGREFEKGEKEKERRGGGKKNTVDLRVRLNQPNYFVQSTRGGAATV